MNKKTAFTVAVKLLLKKVTRMGNNDTNVLHVAKYFRVDFD